MNKLSILISSCLKFSDLWENQFLLLNKFYPNHPKAYLLTDVDNSSLLINENKIILNKNFSDRLKFALELIDSEYILLTLDDYLINAKINEEQIMNIVEYMKTNDIDYFRFFKRSKTKCYFDKDKKIHLLPLTKNCYEVNLYPSIWKKESLLKIVTEENEDIWKFEVLATRRAKQEHLRCVWIDNKNVFPFVDTIRKGKYLRKAYKFLRKNGLYISDRKRRTILEELKLYIKTILSRSIPSKMRLCLIKKFKIHSYSASVMDEEKNEISK